ncbi:MAG: hypothetical protein ACOVNQ_17160, partial [Pirellula sp.]
MTLLTALTGLTADFIDGIDIVDEVGFCLDSPRRRRFRSLARPPTRSTWSILSAVNTVNLVNAVNAVKNTPPLGGVAESHSPSFAHSG